MQTYTPSSGINPASGLFAPFLPAIALKSFKQALGDEIERLIALADEIDGDPDLEPDLAGTPNQGAACDAEGDASDLEPSLGSLGGTEQVLWYASPPIWAAGSLSDAELDDCDLEDGHDAEDDPAERGIGDQDGLEEQAGLFDRSGEEPERIVLHYRYERDIERRQRLADVERQARSLAARIRPGVRKSAFASSLLSVDGWEIVR